MKQMIRKRYNIQIKGSILDDIKEKDATFYLISDGSFHLEYEVRTLAWLITSSSNLSMQVYSNNIIPGPIDSQCLYRSELSGLIGGLIYIQKIYYICNIKKANVEAKYDRSEVINKAIRWDHH